MMDTPANDLTTSARALLEGLESSPNGMLAMVERSIFDIEAPALVRELVAEVERLRERNSHLQQKCNSLCNNMVKDPDLQNIFGRADKAPGDFAKDHEYGSVNVIGKAQLRKDLSCCVRLEDLSFFSDSKAIIRKMAKEIQRLRNKDSIL